MHEATASAKQSVHQEMLALQGDVKRAEEMARAAAAASTDEIRANRGTRAWNEALAQELRESRRQVASLQDEKREFFEQQMRNGMEEVSRKNKASSEPMADKRKKKVTFEEVAS